VPAHKPPTDKTMAKRLAHLLLLRRVALAPLVHVCATPTQLLWRPLQLQAMEAGMVPSVAVVGARVGFTWEATGRKAGRRRQLGSAPPTRSLATIELLGTSPSLHPLQWPLVVPSVAIERARRCGACRRRRRRRRRRGPRGWGWGWRCRASHAIVLATPALLIE